MLDAVQIQFNPDSFLLLNSLLALMMFGASLSVRWQDFALILKSPKAPIIGLVAQFILLPALTYALVTVLSVEASLALGMILVASCPGGSFSNIMTWLARGHLATSVSMTAISTVAALVMTPLNFSFYAGLSPETRAIVQAIAVSPMEIMQLVLMVLVLPLFAGMLVGQWQPGWAKKLDRPFRWLSLVLFFAFVAIAFSSNGALFIEYAGYFAGLVILHNAMAICVGWLAAKLAKLDAPQTRAVTLEVGIQNSGLGLIILFNFFPNLGGMMLITAFWGVWHLVSGLLVAGFWSRKAEQTEVALP